MQKNVKLNIRLLLPIGIQWNRVLSGNQVLSLVNLVIAWLFEHYIFFVSTVKECPANFVMLPQYRNDLEYAPFPSQI